MDTLVNEQEELKKAVNEAFILLDYISSKGKISEEDKAIIVAILIKPEDVDKLSKEEQVNFWLAYSKLSQLAKPATIESILLSKEVIKGKAPFAISIVKRYRTSGLITIILLLILQMYWIVGVGLLADVRSLPKQIEESITLKEERTKELGNQAADDLKISFMEAKIENLYTDLETSSNALKEWNIAYRFYSTIKSLSLHATDSSKQLTAGAPALTFSEDDVSEDRKINYALKYSPYVLDLIQSYLLPLLYGLLGGFAYILRNLSKEIHESAFTIQSRASYLLRIFLGALSGLAIGWFFGTGDNDGASIGNLSPLALAFLAGYSVEVLFTLMDKLIEVITKAAPSTSIPSKT